MKKVLKYGLIGFVVLIVLVAVFGSGSDDTSEPASNESTQSAEPTEEAPAEEEPTEEPTKEAKPEPELTSGQENALASAEQYLDYQAFSHKGLVQQLKFEGYSTKDATFAANNVSVNWNEQAVKSAEQYLSTSPFSKSGLIEQLEFEGYTTKQAVYGATQALK